MYELAAHARRLFSPRQCRAARALLAWSRAELARRCGLEEEAVELYEAGGGELVLRERIALGAALHAGGVVAVQARYAGEGVRFAKPGVGLDVQ